MKLKATWFTLVIFTRGLSISFSQEVLQQSLTVDTEGDVTEVIDLDHTSETADEKPSDDQLPELPSETKSAIHRNESVAEESATTAAPPVQVGPFVDLFGPSLLSLQMINGTQARLENVYTNDAIRGKEVIGLYFSADWCGPCKTFTPELVSFYNRMNKRRRKENKFLIVWVSRCRDMQSFGNYFTQMNWLALPPEEAMGQRGQLLSEKFKVKGIPHLVLLDDMGGVITYEGRNKIPQDMAGIGFPWQNPLVSLFRTVVPRSLRLILNSHINQVRSRFLSAFKGR